MEFPPQTDPVCSRCGTPVGSDAVPVVVNYQTKQVCPNCAKPAEKAAANPQREESR